AVITLIFPGLELHEEAVENFRRLLPYLALVPLMAVLKGTLHCHRKDASALFPQALQNAALIFAGLVLISSQAGESERAQGWTVAFLGGAGLSLLWLIIQLLKVSRFPWPTFHWKVPGQRRFLLDFGTLLASQILLQAYSLLAFHLASELPTGSITWLETAFRFHFFPVALVGVSLGIVAGDESADLASRGEHQRLAQMLTRNQRLAAFLGFLAGAGLLATSTSIIDTLFVRGEFSPEDGLNTANILWWYCFAVPFACMNIGLQRTAIAIGLRKKVMLISLVGLGLQLGILFSPILPMDTGTIALAYVASTGLSWIFLKWILHKNLELPRPRIIVGLKLLILGILVQQTASYSIHILDQQLPQFLGRDLSILGFTIATGVWIALVVGKRLHMKEAHDMGIVFKSWTGKRSDPTD
ncbi:MAG: lipid II flippase MurJ, partial [Planctomycetota bacterium]|nr:lipid II flippase MurJ [Planctomycetota bacterium]